MRGGFILALPVLAHLHTCDVRVVQLLGLAQVIKCSHSVTAHCLQGVQVQPARHTNADH